MAESNLKAIVIDSGAFIARAKLDSFGPTVSYYLLDSVRGLIYMFYSLVLHLFFSGVFLSAFALQMRFETLLHEMH